MMSQKILNRDPKDEILKAFRLFDDDETGKISSLELTRLLLNQILKWNLNERRISVHRLNIPFFPF